MVDKYSDGYISAAELKVVMMNLEIGEWIIVVSKAVADTNGDGRIDYNGKQ